MGLLGDIGGIWGAYKGAKEQKKADRRAEQQNIQSRGYALTELRRSLGILEEGEIQGSALLREMLDSIEGYQQQQLGMTSVAETNGYRAINDNYQRSSAGVEQMLSRRGLSGTTAGANFQRAAATDYTRQLGGLDASLSQQRVGILGRSGAQYAQGLGNLAQHSSNFANARAGVFRDKAAVYQNYQFQSNPNIAAGYGQLGASVGTLADRAWAAWGGGGGSVGSGGQGG